MTEIDKLLEAFAQAAKQHYFFTQNGDNVETNREADILDQVYFRLAKSNPVGKMALLPLLKSPDLAVATMAAAYCMHFAPQETKAVFLRAVKEKSLLGLGAKYALKRFEDGTWQKEPVSLPGDSLKGP